MGGQIVERKQMTKDSLPIAGRTSEVPEPQQTTTRFVKKSGHFFGVARNLERGKASRREKRARERQLVVLRIGPALSEWTQRASGSNNENWPRVL